MENVIGLIILVIILVLAVRYVVQAKKKGHKCIGCPNGCCTSEPKATSCGCGCGEDT